MSWYYADNGRQAGPVDDASLDALIAQGVVRPDTLVWREGMANWQALNSARPPAAPPVSFAPPPPPAPAPVPVYTPPQQEQPSFQPQQPLFQAPMAAAPVAGGVTCANCGQVFAQTDVVFIGSSYVCAGCKPVFLQRMREGSVGGAAGIRRYGGFWIRFAAALIDGIIISVASNLVVMPLSFALIRSSEDPMAALGLQGILVLFQIGVACAYFGYFLSTRGATPGKMLLGLRVIRSDGSGLSFARGGVRYLAQFVSGIILGIGYIIAAFDAEKRALHDHLCDTRVVYK